MELKVWVDGVVRVVCGLSEETSCQDVVIALAQAIGEWNPRGRGTFRHVRSPRHSVNCRLNRRPRLLLFAINLCPPHPPLKCCLHNSAAEQIYCKQSVAAPRRKAGVAGFSPLFPRPPFHSALTQISSPSAPRIFLGACLDLDPGLPSLHRQASFKPPPATLSKGITPDLALLLP